MVTGAPWDGKAAAADVCAQNIPKKSNKPKPKNIQKVEKRKEEHQMKKLIEVVTTFKQAQEVASKLEEKGFFVKTGLISDRYVVEASNQESKSRVPA